ncbi:nuclear transport factor 2 family protein [Chloroflexota bacterium]
MNELEKQIKQVFDAYKAAVFAKDVNAFVALYDDNVHIFDMWEKWSHDGIKAWRGMATEWLGSLGDERVVVEFDDLQITGNQDFAIAYAFVTYKAISVDGKELRSLNNRITLNLKNTKGVWKIIHEHTSAPVDGSTQKVNLHRE